MNGLLKIYCIVVTYNGEKYIRKCLNHLLMSSLQTTVIVIDNNSRDSTLGIIRTDFPGINLIGLETNVGFGRANNIGFNLAHTNKADFVLLLNQDVYVETNTLELLIQIAIENRHYGVLSPMHLDGTGKKLDHNFQTFVSGVKSLWSDLYARSHKMEDLYTCTFVNAAAWLISARCLSAVGGFDPLFFHYGEDNDFSNRVAYKNFRIGICPKARIYHDRSDGNKLFSRSELSVRYMFSLIHLKNINRRLPELLRELYSDFIADLISSFINLELKRAKLVLQLTFRLLMNARTVYVHREISRRDLAFLDSKNTLTVIPSKHEIT